MCPTSYFILGNLIIYILFFRQILQLILAPYSLFSGFTAPSKLLKILCSAIESLFISLCVIVSAENVRRGSFFRVFNLCLVCLPENTNTF